MKTLTDSASDLVAKYVGKRLALVANGHLMVPVRCVDAKNAYGRDLLLVQPERGMGSKWVWAEKCQEVTDEWPIPVAASLEDLS